MKLNKTVFVVTLFLTVACSGKADPGAGNGWWPVQKKPVTVVTCVPASPQNLREMNLAQSVSGLAARAVNIGLSDEGVWIQYNHPGYAEYYSSMKKRLGLRDGGSSGVWALVKKYFKKKIIKGYILYDCTREDNSINLATVYAGLDKAILVDLQQEKEAVAAGLLKLRDLSVYKPSEDDFLQLRSKLNPHLLVLSNPKIANNRDYAIAQQAMLYYGVDSLLEKILSWVEPLSPVIGWNQGDEFKHIEPCSRWGLINTVSDFCMNLPMLSIGGGDEPGKIKSLDLRKIDWSTKGRFHSFVMSDGDNLQWTSNQFISSPEYWANPANSSLHMSFTSCLANLSQASPDIYSALKESQPEGVSLVEYGGGYYYPDLFAASRPDRYGLARKLAKRINEQMHRTGTRVFGVICKKLASAEAQEMFRIFASEIDDLTGIIAVQYAPYNGGNGTTYWVPGKNGTEIPVMTARFQLWANQSRKGSGNPDAVARLINEDSASVENAWTIVHAWSRFDRLNGVVTDVAKNGKNGERGVTPVKWTSEALSPEVHLVSIEELLWRLRMQHNPVATKKLAGITN